MKKYRLFALMSFVFVALAAYALTPATQWGDVSPTNTLAKVAYDAGLMSTNHHGPVRIQGNLHAYGNTELDGSVLCGPGGTVANYGFVVGGSSVATGQFSVAMGNRCIASKNANVALGYEAEARGNIAIALGLMARANDDYSYVWQGVPTSSGPDYGYYSHGRGTYNINPVGGLSGFWIGETNMEDHIVAFAPKLAYNLYPVDLGGGTREVPSDTQTYMAIGYDVSVTGMASTVVGNAARARGENSSAFGYGAEALADNSLVVGAHSTAGGTQSLAIGVQAAAGAYGFAIGNAAEAPADGTALGFQAKGTGPGTAIGAHAEATGWESAAIGHNAVASGASSIQLGTGTNNSNNSVKVYGRMLLDADGHVPLLTGQSYDLSDAADVTRALGDIITALGGTVE